MTGALIQSGSHNGDATSDKYKFGLRPLRPHPKRKIWHYMCLADIVLRCTLLAGLIIWHYYPECINQFHSRCTEALLDQTSLMVLQVEAMLAMILFWKFARWEAEGHFITFWQVLGAMLVFFSRRSLYLHPFMMLFAFLGLWLTYLVGVRAEFTAPLEPRIPPFCPKSGDTGKPKHGWLGKWISRMRLFQSKSSRVALSVVLYVGGRLGLWIFLYAFFLSHEDDLRGLDVNLDLLFYISIGLAILATLPDSCVYLTAFSELMKDLWNMKRSSNAYRTGPYEVALLDDDLREESTLNRQLRTHLCQPLTILIPAYMPNEEEIMFDVFNFYRKQAEDYPNDLKILFVWNSPNEHPEAEERLREYQEEWPNLKVVRNPWSTSKCDNLNMACDYIETEFVLLNDSDTMVSAATMKRASMHIFGEEQLDLAQCSNTHCYDDTSGRPDGAGSGCFAMGALITAYDAAKPMNISVQGTFKHSPFNGRGGFWRTAALKKVQFDHRTVGEDHDSFYRGVAFYGLKGLLDPNMLCQEREPPDCKSLTSQRIRWETAALEMRHTFNWVLRSEYYSSYEAFILLWSQLMYNCNMPFQCLPLQMATFLPLCIMKGYLVKHVWGNDKVSFQTMCAGEDCISHFTLMNPLTEHLVKVALPLTFVVLAVILLWGYGLILMDCFCRATATRWRPRPLWLIIRMTTPIFMFPFYTWIQFWALHDYCWGGAKFIPTTRSPGSSPKSKSTEDKADGV